MALPKDAGCDIKSEIIEFKRKNIPHEPGVYIFKDSNGNVIYVGKAKDLYHRVNSYFQSKCFEDSEYGSKIRKLVETAADLEFIIMDTEKEAFILENELIKKYQPRFNSDLKDDRFYPWIVISTNEKYPRINVIQSPRYFDPTMTYFGPYTNVGMMRKTLKLLRSLFPFCACSKPIPDKPAKRPCLNYQLKQCPGPCIQKITPEEYAVNIDSIKQI
jgi:excinuclease ABC subunit C